MASIRKGYSDDFVIKNNKVGIGSSNPQETLDVVGGALQGQDLKVTGVSTQTGYTGFLRSKHEIEENTTLRRSKISDQGGNVSSLSGEIIVGTGITVTIDSVGVGTTVVGVGTETTTNIITPSNITQAGSGQLNSLKVFNTFTPPSGGTNERPAGAKPGQLFYNYDLKTIEFFDGYGWRQVDNTTRSGRVVIAGGYGLLGSPAGSPGVKSIQSLQVMTLGSSEYFGELNQIATEQKGVASNTRAVFAGGYVAPARSNIMQYTTLASTGNAQDFGNLTLARNGVMSSSSSTRGVYGGGFVAPAINEVIDYIEISTIGDAIDFGNLTTAKSGGQSANSPTRGVMLSGYHVPVSTDLNQSDYITIASKGNATDFGGCDIRITGSGCGSSTRGIFAGGYVSNPSSVKIKNMEHITFATFGNTINFGDLTHTMIYAISGSTSTRGIFTGSGPASPFVSVDVDYVSISSLGDATDWGDLSTGQAFGGGVSDSHGGLGGF